jgi:hypothetical protein
MAGQKREARLRDPAVHVFARDQRRKTWITGPSPVMTARVLPDLQSPAH